MLKIFTDEISLSKNLAIFILKKIKIKKNLVLGCPSGRSLKKTYYYLGILSKSMNIDISKLKIVMMDEFIIKKNNKYQLCNNNSHYSCIGYANKTIKKFLNYKKKKNQKFLSSNIYYPNIYKTSDFDIFIKELGGIDIFLLASGSSDGHVAFNNSKTKINTSSHIIKLSNLTRKDNLRSFPKFKSISDVPKYGVTIGLKTIYKYTKIAILVLSGKEKKIAAQNILTRKSFTNKWPASIIYKCKKKYIYVDILAKNY